MTEKHESEYVLGCGCKSVTPQLDLSTTVISGMGSLVLCEKHQKVMDDFNRGIK